MNVRLLHARAMDAELIRQWAHVQRGDRAFDSPFFSPEFTAAVAAVREDVEVAVLERAGEPVGFFPFQRDARGIGRPVGLRLSDLQGVVVQADCDWGAEELIRCCDLRAWHFDHLLASQTAFGPFQFVEEESPYIDLSGGFDAYADERREAGSAVIHQTQRKARKVAREVAPLRFELNTTDRDVFAALRNWMSIQRRETGTLDVLDLPWALALVERIAVTKASGFQGVTSALYAGDELLAAHLGMASERVLHFWLPAYNRAYGRFSPGSILLLELARAAAATGWTRIDLGKGPEHYKSRFRSGAFPVAEGSVDPRPLHRLVRRAWTQGRQRIRSSRLAGPVGIAKRLVRRALEHRPPT